MVTLAIEGSGGSELTYHLTKDTVSVGASSQNDVVLRAPGVAPRHIVIQRNGRVYTFVCQHRQVVVLNGERRARGVLRLDDRIRIGTATLVFKGLSDGEVEVEEAPPTGVGADGSESEAEGAIAEPKQRPVRARAEVALYRESPRLAEARQQMVEIFRSGLRSDLVPSLRTFLGGVFGERPALLAWLDDEGHLQPVVSQWVGDVPNLPARTFQELAAGGRYAQLRLGTRRIFIYPVETGQLRAQAYLLLETRGEEDDEDQVLLAELARMLAVHWERIERSGSLFGQWEASARRTVETRMPGSSHAIRVLRDSVIPAARSAQPVLVSGRSGSGRTTVAALIASLHPRGPLPVQIYQGQPGEDGILRASLLGGETEGSAGVMERARGGVLIVRDVHLLPASVQREVAAAIRHDLAAGYGPSVRWMATTGEDALKLLNDGALDEALFGLFQNHLMRVPALEERREDLPLLIVRLLDSVASEQGKEIRGIELETLNSLIVHPFPGQMTELLAELRRLVSATPSGEMVRGRVPVGEASAAGGAAEAAAVGTADLLSLDDLKVVIPGVERLVIDRVLRRTKGNQSKAARILNLSRGALIAKMKEYEISDYRYLRRRGR